MNGWVGWKGSFPLVMSDRLCRLGNTTVWGSIAVVASSFPSDKFSKVTGGSLLKR